MVVAVSCMAGGLYRPLRSVVSGGELVCGFAINWIGERFAVLSGHFVSWRVRRAQIV